MRKPDLDITDVSVIGTQAYGETVTLKAAVKNIGDVTWDQQTLVANDDFRVKFYVDGSYVGASGWNTWDISVNDTDYFSVNWNVDEIGTHPVKAIIDRNSNAPAEKSYSNQEHSENFTFQDLRKPDLDITDVSVIGTQAYGETVTLKAAVKNIGDVTWDQQTLVANDDFRVKFYVDGSYVGASGWNTYDISVNDTDYFSVNWNVDEIGTHPVKAVIERASNAPAEKSYSNQEHSENFTFQDLRKPDLDITDVSVIGTQAYGETVTLKAAVKNIGDVTWDQQTLVANDDFRVKFYVDGSYVGASGWNTYDISVNDTDYFSVNWNVDEIGTHPVKAVIERASNAPAEKSYSNQEHSENFTFQDLRKPDLDITDVSVIGTKAYGQTVTLKAAVKNIGDVTWDQQTLVANDDFRVKFYVDGSYVGASGWNTYDISVNDTDYFSVNWNVDEIGTHPVKAVIERASNAPAEKSYSNQEHSENFTFQDLRKPDLDITDVSVIGTKAYGQTVTLKAAVKNIGDVTWDQQTLVANDDFRVKFYVDGSYVGASGWNIGDISVNGTDTFSYNWQVDKTESFDVRAVIERNTNAPEEASYNNQDHEILGVELLPDLPQQNENFLGALGNSIAQVARLAADTWGDITGTVDDYFKDVYQDGQKWLAHVSGSVPIAKNIGLDLGASFVFDLADYYGVTVEGSASGGGYVTCWIDGDAGISWSANPSPITIGASLIDISSEAQDPERDWGIAIDTRTAGVSASRISLDSDNGTELFSIDGIETDLSIGLISGSLNLHRFEMEKSVLDNMFTAAFSGTTGILLLDDRIDAIANLADSFIDIDDTTGALVLNNPFRPFTNMDDGTSTHAGQIVAISGGHDLDNDSFGDLAFRPSLAGNPVFEDLTVVFENTGQQQNDFFVEASIVGDGWRIAANDGFDLIWGDDDKFDVANVPAGAVMGRFANTNWLVAVAPDAAETAEVTFELSYDGWLFANEVIDTQTVTLTKGTELPNSPPTDITLNIASIPEDATVGVPVGQFTVSDPDSEDSHTFELLDDAGGLFSVNQNTGALSLEGILDADLPGFAGYHTLQARVTDSAANTLTESFTITIGNVIDEEPEDIGLTANTLPENATLGTVVGHLSTIDLDIGDTHTYELLGNTSSMFAIQNSNALVLNGALDYETAAKHQITVKVTDSGNLPYEKDLTITVGNVNEAPTDIELSDKTIPEDAALGATIGYLSAIDQDVGDTHTYQLLGNASSMFAIQDSNTLVLNGALDHETAAKHQITVRVTDSGNLPYEKDLTITVGNVNEAPTDIELSDKTIPEDAALGATIGYLSAIDQDVGDTHAYELLGNASGMFTIQGSNALVLNGALDYETAAEHRITVKVTDSGNLPYEKDFTITVGDVNKAPTDIELSDKTIPEDAALGATIGYLSAIDQDVGDTHTYQLLGNAGGMFTIDQDSNALIVSGELDYETAQEHQVTVRVTDSGNLTYQEDFTIAVGNVNEAPVDIEIAYNTLPEDAALGTIAGHIFAIDQDIGDTHTYQILDDAGGMFTVDSDSGAIILAGFLDYETDQGYQIIVQATDSGGLVSDPEEVDITVADVAPEDNDTLHGGDGQDLLLGGDGHDILYGEEDADIFYFRDGDSGTDTIRDFDAAEGDRIDISEFLEDYDAASDDIHDYIGTAQEGGNTYLNINPDGVGLEATTVAILEGVSTTLDDLLDGGNLVTV